MKRQSVVGPILLILIGVLFLTRNLWQQIPLFELLAHYWPFILIGWGLLRLVEVAVLAMSGKPISSRLSGGEIVLIVLLCMVGSAMMAASKSGIHVPRIGERGIEIFGQQYDYDQTAEKPAPAAVHVILENLRGNVRITGSDQPQVRVEQHKTVRAMQKSEGDQADRETPIEIVSEGDRIIVRTNQERVSGRRRIASDLEVTVPRGASIEARATYGDFDITDVAGSVDINSANAGVRLNKIGGNVKIDLGRSDIIRAVGVKGAVDLQGKGSDIDLEDMAGQVTINGTYSGTLQFKNLAKPLHFESRQTDLRVAQIPGSITMDLGDFTANNLIGPIRLVTRSRDIRIEDFTQSLELESERGDIELRPGKSPLPKIDAKARNGKVDLILPEAAQFDLKLSTNRGEAHNDFGSAIKMEIDGQSSTLKGSVGKGPAINIITERGSVSVKKSDAAAPAARTLAILFAINVLNFYDRHVLGALGEPIRKEFHLSDTQLGAITTLFTVLYAVVGLPLGRLADSASRKKLLAAGMFVWSALTAASAFTASYATLLLTRLGVGVGEAVCAPVSASWIGDLFPPQKRSRALAFFMLGVPLGGGLSYLVSGPVAQAYGWRMALVVAAVPALVLIPALLLMPEPRRGAVEGNAPAASGWGVLLRIPTLGWIIASGALLNFNLYALATFLPAFLTRFHHLSVAQSGWWTGVGSIAAGLLFASASGMVGDRVIGRRKNGRMLAASAAMAAAAPIALAGILQPEGAWVASVVLISAAYGCLNMYYGLVYAAIQDIVAPALRGTTMALYFMAMYLCGASFGPIITGRLSDAMARRAAGSEILTEAAKAIGLRQAMFVVPALALALALVLYAGSRTIARDMARRDELLTIPAAKAL